MTVPARSQLLAALDVANGSSITSPGPAFLEALRVALEEADGDAKEALARPTGTGTKGDPGLSAYQVARAAGYGGTETQWLASLVGPAGQSAYQAAQAAGYGGTQAQWVASLNGTDGIDGDDGADAVLAVFDYDDPQLDAKLGAVPVGAVVAVRGPVQ